MTHKYERNCWSCGSTDLMPDTYGVRCRNCGATWNVVPEMHNPIVEPGSVIMQIASGPIKVKGYRVSKTTANKAARARTKAT